MNEINLALHQHNTHSKPPQQPLPPTSSDSGSSGSGDSSGGSSSGGSSSGGSRHVVVLQ